MKRRKLMAAAVAALVAWPALAHGPTPQELTRTLAIAAPPDKVWAALKDPAAIADWHPDIASASMAGEGAHPKRTVTFKAGGTLVDGIDDVSDDKMTIRWRLSKEDIAVFPTSFYTNTVSVAAKDAGSEVTWVASFFRADTTNEPPEQYSDEAAVAAMEKFADDGLKGLKDKVESGG